MIQHMQVTLCPRDVNKRHASGALQDERPLNARYAHSKLPFSRVMTLMWARPQWMSSHPSAVDEEANRRFAESAIGEEAESAICTQSASLSARKDLARRIQFNSIQFEEKGDQAREIFRGPGSAMMEG